jgi:flagellar hook-length control protein FliK
MSGPVASHITVVQVAATLPAVPPAAPTQGAMEADFPLLLARQLAADAAPVALGASPFPPRAGEGEKAEAEEGVMTGQGAVPAGLPLPVAPLLPPAHAAADKAPARLEGNWAKAEASPLVAPDPAGLPAKLAAALPKLPPEGGEGALPTSLAEGDSASGLALVATKTPASPLEVPARAEGLPPSMAATAHAGGPVRPEMPAAAAVAAPVGSAQWGAEFAQKVVWLAREEQSIAQIQVTPPQLGPIEIRLSLNQDQASMTFVSPHAAVREAIEAALPRLREMFAESGLTLGNVDVAAQSFGGQRHGEDEAHRTAQPAPGLIPLGGALPPWRKGEGLVDVFA